MHYIRLLEYCFIMSFKSLLFLAAVTLPSLVAFTVTFGNGDVAEYELIEVKDKSSVQFLHGDQAFVRFARVVSSPSTYVFQKGEEVALKIGYANKEKEMRREQSAHSFIQNNAPGKFIEGVVRAEIALGESFDLMDDENLVLPIGRSKQEKYFILIMEPLGMDMITMHAFHRGFSKKEVENFYDSLRDTLKKLKKIKLRHGDIKPQNMIFKKSNKIEDGIKLVDLGLAIFEGSGMTECGGDPLYISPIQYLELRPATYDDLVVSLAYSITYVGTGYLPWLVFIEDSESEPSKKIYDLHNQRILVSKHEFNLDPFSTFSQDMRLSQSLQRKIIRAVKRATSHEFAKVKSKIQGCKDLIATSTKNGN